jgi:hypothetical protein
MARPLWIKYPAALYDVTGRENARMVVLEDDTHRQGFVNLLASVIERYDWRCYAYTWRAGHEAAAEMH